MVTANETESATLMFRTDNAAPPVNVINIRWFYSPDFASSLYEDGAIFEEITGLDTRPGLASTYSFTSDRLSLTIGNIVQARVMGDLTDAGRYFLEATNEAGVDSSYIDIIVFGKFLLVTINLKLLLKFLFFIGDPVIIAPPEDQFSINNGSSAVFVCRALAFPNHIISWTFTDISGVVTESISSDSKYSIVDDRNINRFGELTVVNVDYRDRGVYTCTATNSIGSDMASANLTVHGELIISTLWDFQSISLLSCYFSLMTVSPLIGDTSSLTEVRLGRPAVLVCLVTGFPLPSISWRKDSEEFTIGDDPILSSRIDFLELPAKDMAISSFNGSDLQGILGHLGNGSIVDAIVDQVLQLGELGVVGLLSFNETVRGDTANYTCTATNSLPETVVLMAVSDKIPLVILGEYTISFKPMKACVYST